jgi:hypothetical protein
MAADGADGPFDSMDEEFGLALGVNERLIVAAARVSNGEAQQTVCKELKVSRSSLKTCVGWRVLRSAASIRGL